MGARRLKTWLGSLQPTHQGAAHCRIWFSERLQQVLKRLMLPSAE